jgi:uncharacterized membrane protein YqjE
MRDIPGGEGGGLFAALKNIAATVLASGETRLELLANEVEEEKLRAVNLLIVLLGMAFCLCAGTLIAVFFLTALFWENRLFVLGASGVFFLILGFVFYGLFKRAIQRPEKMFAASLAELREDLRQLKAVVGQDENAD